MKPRLIVAATLALAASGGIAIASNASARAYVLGHYAAEARRSDPGFTGFSAAAGKAFYLAHSSVGRPGMQSCAACHTTDPRGPGRLPNGRSLAPMAVSSEPKRFVDLGYAERWFRRMCNTVYHRACTPIEKGDFVAYMESQ